MTFPTGRHALFIIALCGSMGALPAAHATPAELALQVTDASSDKPVFQADVRANVSGVLLGAVTDTSGECIIPFPEGQPVRSLVVTISAAGYVPVILEWRRKAEGDAPPASCTLRLEPGTVIGGTVEDGAGMPVSGATVSIYVEPQAVEPDANGMRVFPAVTDVEATTDDSGKWQCDIIPATPAKVRLRLAAAGQNYYKSVTYTQGGENPIERLRDMSVVLVVEERFSVKGVVLNPDGSPAAAADVLIWPVDSIPRRGTEAVTDETGAFECRNCKPGDSRLLVRADGCALDLRDIALSPEMAPLDIRLTPGNVLKGRVVDQHGAPVEGAYLSTKTWRGHEIDIWQGKTDQQGYFSWDGAPADEVEFVVSAEGCRPLHGCVLSVSEEEPKLTLQAFLLISGQVTDAQTGDPIDTFEMVPGTASSSDGPINWLTESAAQIAGGAYTHFCEDAHPLHAVRIQAQGYRPAESPLFSVKQRSAAFDARLEPVQKLVAHVHTPDGAPAEGAMARLIAHDEEVVLRLDKTNLAVTKTDADGNVAFTAPEKPSRLLVMHERGFAFATVAEGQTSIDVALDAPASVTGKARVGTQPSPDATVALEIRLFGEGNTREIVLVYSATADAEGAFRFASVPPWEARIGRSVTMPDGGSFLSHVNYLSLQPGAAAEAVIGGAGLTVQGALTPAEQPELFDPARSTAVLEAKRSPIPVPGNLADVEQAIWIAKWLRSEDGKSYARQERRYVGCLDASGSLRIEDVLPGAYILHVKARGTQGGIAETEQSIEVPANPDGSVSNIGTLALDWKRAVAEGCDFVAETLDGKTIAMSDFRGKFLLLDFWATWCGPCRGETPHLKAVFDRFGTNPRFAMVGLSLDEAVEEAREYVKANGMAWTQGYLGSWPTTDVPDRFGVRGIPAIMLFGPEGQLIARDLRGPAIAEAIARALPPE